MRVLDTDQSRRLVVKVFKDQHGRPWELTLDKETLVHTTPPIPRFRAPLMPPIEYVKPHPTIFGRVRIDYGPWEEHWARAADDWDKWRVTVGRLDLSDADKQAVTGPMPQSVEFVRAAKAGNRWVLGLPHPTPGMQYAVPAWAKPLVADGRLGPDAAPRGKEAAARARQAARARYADEEEAAATGEPLEAEILPPLGRGRPGEDDDDETPGDDEGLAFDASDDDDDDDATPPDFADHDEDEDEDDAAETPVAPTGEADRVFARRVAAETTTLAAPKRGRARRG